MVLDWVSPRDRIAVVIPCYQVKEQILSTIARIGREVDVIYAIDDCCPQGTGEYIQANVKDSRVRVIYHSRNQGVGGATMTGYRYALKEGATVIVKIDGDGQMDPKLIPRFVRPILTKRADYTKGNRFYHPEDLVNMPLLRMVGNAGLSFLTKLSSGYWHLFDPTNGYTAIHARVLELLPLDKISRDFFFESDLLFRLNIIRAVVMDIPMTSCYGDEVSNLKIFKVIIPFLRGHGCNFIKRIVYNYYLRNFSIASLELLLGMAFLMFGIIFGSIAWWNSAVSGQTATAGTVMLAALPVILGVQLLLSFINYDIASNPRIPLIRKI